MDGGPDWRRPRLGLGGLFAGARRREPGSVSALMQNVGAGRLRGRAQAAEALKVAGEAEKERQAMVTTRSGRGRRRALERRWPERLGEEGPTG